MDKKEIIEYLSDKYHVPKHKIEEAIHSQFKFAKEYMEQDTMPTVRLPYFGKFIINKQKLKHIQHNVKRTQTNQQSSKESKEES